MPDKSIAQKLRENLAALKAQNAPRERIDEEVAYWQSKIDAISAQDPERQRSAVENVGAGAQTFSDALTLGLLGLVDDAVSSAVSGDTFQERRLARKENKRELATEHPGIAAGLEVAGSVAPALIPGAAGISLTRGALGKAALAAGKGVPRRMLAKAAQSQVPNLMAQGAVAGGVGELGDGDSETALGGAVMGAGGGLAGAGIGKMLASGQRTVGRVLRAKNLDKAALDKVKQLQRADAVNYGRASAEAEGMTSPAIKEYLETDAVAAPRVARIRRGAEYRGEQPSDADVLMKNYKQLSADQRGIQGKIDRGEYDPELSEQDLADIVFSKKQALRAAETPTQVTSLGRAVEAPAGLFGWETGRVVTEPSVTSTLPGLEAWRGAIGKHAELSGEIDALSRGADIGRLRGRAAAIKGDDLGGGPRSPASFEEFDVPKMTKPELEMALTGVLGGGREAVRLSGNPITAFNVIPSAVRVPLYMARNRGLVKELERRLGRGGIGQDTEQVISQALARLLGAGAGH